MRDSRIRTHLLSIVRPDRTGQRAFPRMDLLILTAALIGSIGLVAGDVYQRWISTHPMTTLDIDGTFNVATWFHSTVLAGAALSLIGIAFTYFDTRRRLQWLVAGAGVAFFSLDKAISLHERVGYRLNNELGYSDAAARLLWQAAWAPIILVTGVALILCVWESHRGTRRWLGGAILGGATKLAMEAMMFPAARYFGLGHRANGIEVNVEESVQLVAFACLFAGFAQLFVDRLVALARGETDPVAEPLPVTPLDAASSIPAGSVARAKPTPRGV